MEECGNDVTATFSARNQRPAYASEVAPGMAATAIGHMLKKVFAASNALRVMGTLAGDTGAWEGLRKHRNDSPPIIDTTITVNTNIRILFTMAFQSSSCHECVTDVSSLCLASRTSAARSPMMTHGAIVLPVVTRGMMEPSAIRRFSMPWTLSS